MRNFDIVRIIPVCDLIMVLQGWWTSEAGGTKADRYPNTLQAHALLEYAKTLPGNTQDNLSEALFQVQLKFYLPTKMTNYALLGKLDPFNCSSI